jgi:hypothetical protein
MLYIALFLVLVVVAVLMVLHTWDVQERAEEARKLALRKRPLMGVTKAQAGTAVWCAGCGHAYHTASLRACPNCGRTLR